MKIVDLTLGVSQDMPVYPGDPPVKIKALNNVEEDDFCIHQITVGTHVGTHIDAPAHMLVHGPTLESYSADQFVGRGVYVKSFSVEAVQQAGITQGDIVIFDTGTAERFGSESYFTEYPAMASEVAQFLVDTKVKMVGVDTCSIDNQEGYPNHKLLLGNNILTIENLANVQVLAGKEFTVFALPMKLALDGAPARVIAQVH